MDPDVRRKRCSFCGEPGDPQTRRLAGGLGAFLCEECAVHFHGVFTSEEKFLASAVPPPWERMSATELVSVLPRIAATGTQVDAFLVEWVELCRRQGISWAEIGKSLGVSRQAAWERFAQRVERLRESRESTTGA